MTATVTTPQDKSLLDEENRILVVEDEAIVAMDIRSQLEGLGYCVVGTAASGKEACQKAAELRPDLVLMDIHLADQSDGVEAGCRIRQELRIPIVFLTAYADASTLERAKLAQPYGYLIKPFDERDLHTTIQVALYKGKRDRAIEESRDDMLAVLDGQRHGTILLDAAGRVTFLSRAAQRILQTSTDESVGRAWQEVLGLSTSQHAQLEAMIQRAPLERTNITASMPSDARPELRLEIEVQDDPRLTGGKILMLYDVSQVHTLRQMLDGKAQFERIIGKSKPMEQVFQLIRDFARVDSTVMIEGQTGTGKELVARAIHQQSARKQMPFIALNCAGLGDELAASQLFGYRRGAFTGAMDDRPGLFEAADGGTLFLDEIGELSMRVQTTLLRVLEERAVMRIGETRLRPINTRIIVATNRSLSQEVAANRFRADLLYRIRVARVQLPLLSTRREDIPILVRAFLAEHTAVTGKRIDAISDDALSILIGYEWPGNVRELRNALEYAVIRANGSVVQVSDLPPEILEAMGCEGLQDSVVQDERLRIIAALEHARGNRKEAAEILGISRATFYRRLSQLGIGDAR